MKSMLRNVDDHGTKYNALMFVCPGCQKEKSGPAGSLGSSHSSGLHMLPVNSEDHSPSWNWDGNLEAPTVSPSILTRWGNDSIGIHVCHSFLRNGVFEYLSDCTHSYASQQVPLPDLPDWVIREE